MFLVQGLITILLSFLTYFWMVDFPEQAHNSVFFLSQEEQTLAITRINRDRKDVEADTFAWMKVLQHARDPKVYAFACMFFLLNMVTTSLAYFLPIILQGGFGFSEDKSILLAAPPYYWAVVPVVLSSIVGDRFKLRGPIILFNSVCLIAGFSMLGFTEQPAVRYVGVCLATGAYVSNWVRHQSFQLDMYHH